MIGRVLILAMSLASLYATYVGRYDTAILAMLWVIALILGDIYLLLKKA